MSNGQKAQVRDFCLFGAPLDTGNLGVSALGVATLAGLSRASHCRITVFDNGRGVRRRRLELEGGGVTYRACGAWLSRRFYRPESLYITQLATRIGLPGLNRTASLLRGADAVFDASGGDSFTDLYGAKRFEMVAMPKRLSLASGRPLVLLPQTYGPFRDTATRRTARQLVRGAAQAWARDAHSYELLAELLGADFDQQRHRQGVDVAFAMPAHDPGHVIDGLRPWLAADEPTVGVNVSGLLFNDAEAAARRFGLVADYPAATRQLIDRLLADGSTRVLLLPHARGAAAESDDRASEQLQAEYAHSGRVHTAPPGLDASGTKWLIGHLDWFTGARMHATIAALSSGVPTMITAYSDKAQGVFEACGVASEVVDARDVATDDLVDAWLDAFQRRDAVREAVVAGTAPVVDTSVRQFEDMIAALAADRAGS